MLFGEAGSQCRNFILFWDGSFDMKEKSRGWSPVLSDLKVKRCIRRYSLLFSKLWSSFEIRNSWEVLWFLKPFVPFGWSGIFAFRGGHPLIVIFSGFSTKKYLGQFSKSFLFRV